jgi:hypothetical protein
LIDRGREKSKDGYAPLIFRVPQPGDSVGVPDVGDVERAASHEGPHGSGLATRNGVVVTTVPATTHRGALPLVVQQHRVAVWLGCGFEVSPFPYLGGWFSRLGRRG